MMELLIVLIQIVITGFTYGAFLSSILLITTIIVFYFTSVTFTITFITIVFVASMVIKFKRR